MNSLTIQGMSGSESVPPKRKSHAFTRLELAAVLGALGLLALLVLPAFANQHERSARVLCVNNLRLMGQAVQQWGTEHGGQVSWRTPWANGTMDGTAGHPLARNIWFQWYWLSNELRTPKILACPSDAQKTPANNWSTSPDGGFLNSHYQNRAVSYLIGLHVFPEDPDGLVAGDRNIRFNGVGDCFSGITGVPLISTHSSGSWGIGDGLHIEAGNYLLKDGHVEELSSEGFVARWLAIRGEQQVNGRAHYLIP